MKEKGWTQAGELQVGDSVAADLSSWLEVEQVVATGGVETVYNFNVADHHTYFVGGDVWGFNVWVHNACGGGPPPAEVEFNADHPFHFFIRDHETSTVVFMGRIEDPLQLNNSLSPKFEPVIAAVQADPLGGDANGDNVVNFSDFLVLSKNFGKTEDAVFADGDFDGNGTVDFTDFLILQEGFGAGHLQMQ